MTPCLNCFLIDWEIDLGVILESKIDIEIRSIAGCVLGRLWGAHAVTYITIKTRILKDLGSLGEGKARGRTLLPATIRSES